MHAALGLVLLIQILNAQTKVLEKKSPNPSIRCTIEVDNREWKRNEPTVISGTIENISGRPLDLAIAPTLYLSPFSPTGQQDGYWAPVDVFNDRPIGLDKQKIGSKGDAKTIAPRPLPLHFKKKGDSIHFRIDAQHLLWDRVISSVWPSMKLFGVVQPGTYEVRLVLESDRGESESNRARVVLLGDPK